MTWWSPVSTSNIVIAIRGCCQRRRVSANGDRPYLLVILLMAEILHQLIGPVGFSHYFKRGLYIPGSAGFLPSTVLILLMEETLPHLKTKKPDLVSLICSVYSRSNQYGFKLTWNPQNWWFVHVFPFPSGHFQVPRCFFFLGGGVYNISIYLLVPSGKCLMIALPGIQLTSNWSIFPSPRNKPFFWVHNPRIFIYI